MTPIQKIEHELIDLKTQINKHPLYKTLETIEDVKIFMGIHVFAVLYATFQFHVFFPVRNPKLHLYINPLSPIKRT